MLNKNIYRNLANMAASQQERVHVSRRENNWVAHINGTKTPIIENNIELFKKLLIENLEEGKEIFFHKPYGQVDKKTVEKEEIEQYIDLHQ